RSLFDHYVTIVRARSRGAGALKNGRNSPQQDLEIQPQRPFLDILQIQLHPFLKRNRASASHLPQACDAWLHAKPSALPVFAEGFIVTEREWTRTHQAHLTLQHVK